MSGRILHPKDNDPHPLGGSWQSIYACECPEASPNDGIGIEVACRACVLVAMSWVLAGYDPIRRRVGQRTGTVRYMSLSESVREANERYSYDLPLHLLEAS